MNDEDEMRAILEDLGATDLHWFRMPDLRDKWRCYIGNDCEFLVYENGRAGEPKIVIRDWRTGCVEHPWPEARDKWEEIVAFIRAAGPMTDEHKAMVRDGWIGVCPDKTRVFCGEAVGLDG